MNTDKCRSKSPCYNALNLSPEPAGEDIRNPELVSRPTKADLCVPTFILCRQKGTVF